MRATLFFSLTAVLCFNAEIIGSLLSRARRMKMPKLSTEEVLTGVFCIAIGGLFFSFII